jgi:nucleotide-binding universal stress UspA family protein
MYQKILLPVDGRGTHGRRGLKRLALGSDAEFFLRSSPVPVLMVREIVEG